MSEQPIYVVTVTEATCEALTGSFTLTPPTEPGPWVLHDIDSSASGAGAGRLTIRSIATWRREA